MKPVKKLLLLMLLPVISYILQACPRCNDTEIPMDFNYLKVELIDNAGPWPQPALHDTLFAGAIAFRATLADTTMMYMAQSPFCSPYISLIREAHASSCIQKFAPKQQIESLSIFTLFPLQENVPAGSDVSALFYGLPPGSSYGENLYITLDQTLHILNNTPYLENWPEQKTDFFLSTEVLYPQAQFEILITFSDNTTLTAISPLIHIRNL